MSRLWYTAARHGALLKALLMLALIAATVTAFGAGTTVLAASADGWHP